MVLKFYMVPIWILSVSACGVVDNIQDCNIVESKFKLQLSYSIYLKLKVIPILFFFKDGFGIE